MTTLHPVRTDDAGRTYYEPVLARIVGVSQYRENEFRLEGIEGFWAPGKNVTVPAILKEGGIAWYTLATKAKEGKNAKPGSLYRDIVKLAPATPEDKEAYNPHSDDMFAEAPETHANGSGDGDGADYAEKALPQPQRPTQQQVWDERDRQIKLGMAFNNLTQLIAGLKSEAEEEPFVFLGFGGGWMQAYAQWAKWFTEASQGRPLSPVEPPQQEPEPQPERSAMVEAAKAMGATELEAQQAANMEVTQLPW